MDYLTESSIGSLLRPLSKPSGVPLTSEPRHGDIKWIHFFSYLARTGYVQLVIIAISLLWILLSVGRRHRYTAVHSNNKTSRAPLPYEICSQAARVSSLAFIVGGTIQSNDQWLNTVIVAVAVILSLLRLTKDIHWRHLALHQVNFLLSSVCATLFAAEILPLLDRNLAYKTNTMIACATISVTISLVIALATPREWIQPSLPEGDAQALPELHPTPEETCSWLEYFMTYGWVSPLVFSGFRRNVNMDDLPGLPWYDDPALMLSRVRKAREKSKNTLWTVMRFVSKEFSNMTVWVVLSYALELVAPFAMYQLLAYLADPNNARYHPSLWLFLLFSGPMARSICWQQYLFLSTRIVVRANSALKQELYHRALNSMELEDDVLDDLAKDQNGKGSKSTSAGRLANLMAGDVESVFNARDAILALIGLPVGLTIALIGLYKILDWAALVGAAVIVLSAPIPTWLSHLVGKVQRRVKLAQDSRISLVGEYLGSMQAIKYFAWEEPMTKHVDEARKEELRHIWRTNVLWVLVYQVSALAPIVALVAMFTIHVLRGQELTAAVAFTTLSLIGIIRNHIGMVGYTSGRLMSAWVSLKRLDRYLGSTTPLTRYPSGSLRIQDATFRRNKKADFRLHDISIDFVEQGLNAVIGQSGSGKTTLLLSILGETVLEQGAVTHPDDIAFASQSAWLQNATIRDNVLFHSSVEQARYDRVVEACCLQQDFTELPAGDATEVGENGGQRSRVALARALYSKAPLILLDDIFSALDSKTAASLWRHCFCTDMLKGRTVVLVTNLPWVAAQADLSIAMENGRIQAIEPHIGVVRTPVSFDTDHDQRDDNDVIGNGVGDAKPKAPAQKDYVEDEMAASGSSGRLTLLKYMLFFGNPLYVVFAVLMSIMSIVTNIGATLWISVWVGAYSKAEAVNIGFYLGIYAAICIGEIVADSFVVLTYTNGGWIAAKKLHEMFITAMMSAPLSWYRNVPVGRIVNRFSRDMMSLDNNLSRMLLIFMEQFIKVFFSLAAISAILPLFMIPAFVTSLFGVLAGEMYIRTAVVVKKLLSSSQSPVFTQFSDTLAGLSVIRARASIPQILANKLIESLRTNSVAYEASYNLNRWVSVRVDFVTSIIMLFAGVIAVSKAGILPAALVGFSLTNATYLGNTILYLVRSMNELEIELQCFNRVLEYATVKPEEQPEAIQTEHGGATANIEDGEVDYPPRNWPKTGCVEFRNVTVKYDLEGPEILKDINLKFSAGERIAIIGRTGSGKSTLVLSLLHLTNIVSGTILYDGVDVTLVSRKKLRQALTIIPQEATLFNGTVASNLDPSGEIPHETLEKALVSCRGIASFQYRDLSSTAAQRASDDEPASSESQPLLDRSSMPSPPTYDSSSSATAGGLTLTTPVEPRGSNFSHGQRQVLSLCRALVRRSQLMLLDEATASMDYETDKGIQAALRRELDTAQGQRTLVTIAHRLRTIADYDKVVVMGSGRVLEVGSPRELIDARGVFFDMVHHSGEAGELKELISAS